MAGIDSSLLNDKFNYYYEKAKQEHKKGNIVLARRNYLLASETLLRLAKISTDKLQKTRVEKAKKIGQLVQELEGGSPPSSKERQNPNKEAQQSALKNWEVAEIPSIKFDDVVGLEKVKKAVLLRMINPIKYPEKYKIYKKKAGGGLLLYGPPGTGKTMIAKAIANEVGAKFYVAKGSDIVSKWVGESEKNISLLFKEAGKQERAIIFIDEMDSLLSKRGADTHNDKRVNEFLQQMDGFASKKEGLLLLGATNRPWDIDSAALRSGRFSQKVYVPLPDEQARRFMFKKFLQGLPLDKDVNIEELVSLTEFYSGADIEELCDRAKEEPLLKAIKDNSIVNISQKHLRLALTQVKPFVDESEIKRFGEFEKKY